MFKLHEVLECTERIRVNVKLHMMQEYIKILNSQRFSQMAHLIMSVNGKHVFSLTASELVMQLKYYFS